MGFAFGITLIAKGRRKMCKKKQLHNFANHSQTEVNITTSIACRKTSHFHRLCLGVLASSVWLDAAAADGCVITEPKKGEPVGQEVQVTGTAKIVPGEHAWLVARRVDFAPRWWPQGPELAVDAKTGEWSGNVVLGGPQDDGWKFDIAVVIVNNKGNAMLDAYRDKAMDTGDWRPIKIQETAAGNYTCQLTVLKKKR